MDDELGKDGAAFVTQPAVPQNQSPEFLELVDGEVRGERGLHALLADNADADIRLENHTHVVAAVADAASALAGEGANLVGYDGLLRGAAAADAYSRRLGRRPQPALLKTRVGKDKVEGAAVNHEQRVGPALEVREDLVGLVVVVDVAHVENLLAAVFEAGRNGDARGRLHLIAR